jgi:hypothetical protein
MHDLQKLKLEAMVPGKAPDGLKMGITALQRAGEGIKLW